MKNVLSVGAEIHSDKEYEIGTLEDQLNFDRKRNMTVPVERTNAVIYTEMFLRELLDPKLTPRVPRKIRDQALRLLRHYPTQYDMGTISDREDGAEELTGHKVFGRSYV